MSVDRSTRQGGKKQEQKENTPNQNWERGKENCETKKEKRKAKKKIKNKKEREREKEPGVGLYGVLNQPGGRGKKKKSKVTRGGTGGLRRKTKANTGES